MRPWVIVDLEQRDRQRLSILERRDATEAAINRKINWDNRPIGERSHSSDDEDAPTVRDDVVAKTRAALDGLLLHVPTGIVISWRRKIKGERIRILLTKVNGEDYCETLTLIN